MQGVREKISFSEWVTWNTCQWRWFQEYRLGKYDFSKNRYSVFGNCVDTALEKYQHRDKEKKLSYDDTVKWFKEKLCEDLLKIQDSEIPIEKDKERPINEKLIKDYQVIGEKILKDYLILPELQNAKILFNQYKIFTKIDRTDDIEIKFKGYIDLVILTTNKKGKKKIVIIDYKTCGWGWPQDKFQDPNVVGQLRFYKYFFAKEYNIPHNDVECAYVFLKRNPGKEKLHAEFKKISVGNTTMMRSVRSLNLAITKMNENNYEKNLNACKSKWGTFCPFYKTDDCIQK